MRFTRSKVRTLFRYHEMWLAQCCATFTSFSLVATVLIMTSDFQFHTQGHNNNDWRS